MKTTDTGTTDGRAAPRGRSSGGGFRGATSLRPGALWAALLAAVAALFVAPAARAQGTGSIDTARMVEDTHGYFYGEKWEGPFFFGAGLAAGGVGAFLLTRNDDIARGAAYPVLAVGLIQLIIGPTLFFKTDAQLAKLDLQLKTDPAAFKRVESARMAGVNSRFIGALLFEAAMIVGGTTTAIVAAQNGCCRTLQGVGLGIAGQGAVSLSLELFAAARGFRYAASLDRFDIGVPTGRPSRRSGARESTAPTRTPSPAASP